MVADAASMARRRGRVEMAHLGCGRLTDGVVGARLKHSNGTGERIGMRRVSMPTQARPTPRRHLQGGVPGELRVPQASAFGTSRTEGQATAQNSRQRRTRCATPCVDSWKPAFSREG
jgi:hypothetical protein